MHFFNNSAYLFFDFSKIFVIFAYIQNRFPPTKHLFSHQPSSILIYNNRLAILTNLLPYDTIAILLFFYHHILFIACVNYSTHNPTINYKHNLSFRLISNLVIQPACTHRFTLYSKRTVSHISYLSKSFYLYQYCFLVVLIIRLFLKFDFHSFFHKITAKIMAATCYCKIKFFHNGLLSAKLYQLYQSSPYSSIASSTPSA